MRLYRILDTAAPEDEPFKPVYRRDLAGAKSYMKEVQPDIRPDMEVAEVETGTIDKHKYLAALQGEPVHEVVRLWRGTRKGGLREVGVAACSGLLEIPII